MLPPAWAPLVAAIGLSAQESTEGTPRQLRGPLLRPFPGRRSSSSERLKPCCRFGWPSSRAS
eukprot:12132392-Alexandrium_andersonii.AAC.1